LCGESGLIDVGEIRPTQRAAEEDCVRKVRPLRPFLAGAGLLALAASGTVGAAQLLTIDTRAGIQQKVLLIKPEKPVATVILFAGGNGVVEITGSSENPGVGPKAKNNFLVRTRESFAAEGLLTAVVDAPSDQQGGRGMLGGFRDSAEHCEDVAAVIRHLRTVAPVPVWLVGTSRGTESAANCTIRLKEAVQGLVLTATMTRPNNNGTHVTAMDLAAVRVPVLVLSHQNDGCEYTPANDAPSLLGQFANAPRKEAKILSGGDPPKAKPCQAMTPHGFLGIEDQAVGTIVKFIKSGP